MVTKIKLPQAQNSNSGRRRRRPRPAPNHPQLSRFQRPTLSGTDYLGSFVVNSGSIDSGEILFDRILNRAQLKNTELGSLLSLYSKYQLESLVLETSSGAPTTVGGTYALGISWETDQLVTTGIPAIKTVRSLPNSKLVSLSTGTSSALSTPPRREWLTTSGPSGHICRVLIVLVDAPPSVAGKFSLSVSARWVFRFADPEVTVVDPSKRTWRIPKGPMGTLIQDKYFGADISKPLESFWSHSAYDTVYGVAPALGAASGLSKDAHYLRTLGDNNVGWCLNFYATLGDAREAANDDFDNSKRIAPTSDTITAKAWASEHDFSIYEIPPS